MSLRSNSAFGLDGDEGDDEGGAMSDRGGGGGERRERCSSDGERDIASGAISEPEHEVRHRRDSSEAAAPAAAGYSSDTTPCTAGYSSDTLAAQLAAARAPLQLRPRACRRTNNWAAAAWACGPA